MGAGFDLRKLDFVREARERIDKVLEQDHTHRALAANDRRMSEAVQCFDLRYAADFTLFTIAVFGELVAPRASDIFVALRRHFDSSDAYVRWVWLRFAGKNNQQVKRRCRGLPCLKGCRRCTTGCSPFQTCVIVDMLLGLLRPESRCAACALEALHALHDGFLGGAQANPNASSFRVLKGKYKLFSWERGAQMMPGAQADSYDLSLLDLPEISRCCFETAPIAPATLNLMFDKWAAQMKITLNPPCLPAPDPEVSRVHRFDYLKTLHSH